MNKVLVRYLNAKHNICCNYLYKSDHFFHNIHRRLGNMPPIHAFAVHRYYNSIESAIGEYHVLHHHKKILSTIHVVILLWVGIFEVCINNSLFIP